MRALLWLGLILVMASSSTPATQDIQKGTHASYSVAISTPQTAVKVGAEIKIDILLTNTSNREILVTVDNGNRGEFDYTIDVLDRNGHEPHETKYFRAVLGKDSGDPGDTSSLVVAHSAGLRQVKPGGTLKSSIDLTQLYDLQPGQYTVRVEDIEQASQIHIRSKAIKLTVTP
jgi:hypothetical protein